MNKFKILIKNLLLFFVALVLLCIFFGVGIITSVIRIIFYKASTNYFKDCAIEIDIFGNVLCQHLFNTVLINKDSKFLFGKLGVTISKVLGLNEREKTLSKTGVLLVSLLDFIDKDHCKKAIMETEQSETLIINLKCLNKCTDVEGLSVAGSVIKMYNNNHVLIYNVVSDSRGVYKFKNICNQESIYLTQTTLNKLESKISRILSRCVECEVIPKQY